MNVPHTALYQNCINDSAPPNMGAARALDKNSLTASPPEPLVKIQNNFTELFLIIPSTKIAQRFCTAEQRGRQSSRLEMPLNDISS